jgi:hypothetical protein
VNIRVPRRSLGDVIGLIARKIRRLTGFVDEIEKDALGDRADESASRLCEWHDVKSQRVPTGRQLPRVAPFTERRKQSVHGVKRKPEAVAISAIGTSGCLLPMNSRTSRARLTD